MARSCTTCSTPWLQTIQFTGRIHTTLRYGPSTNAHDHSHNPLASSCLVRPCFEGLPKEIRGFVWILSYRFSVVNTSCLASGQHRGKLSLIVTRSTQTHVKNSRRNFCTRLRRGYEFDRDHLPVGGPKSPPCPSAWPTTKTWGT